MLQLTNSNFSELITPELEKITARTFTAPNWRTLGATLAEFAKTLDISGLSSNALLTEASALKAWVAIDSHNWSDYTKALIQNKIHLVEYLARKLDN